MLGQTLHDEGGTGATGMGQHAIHRFHPLLGFLGIKIFAQIGVLLHITVLSNNVGCLDQQATA